MTAERIEPPGPPAERCAAPYCGDKIKDWAFGNSPAGKCWKVTDEQGNVSYFHDSCYEEGKGPIPQGP